MNTNANEDFTDLFLICQCKYSSSSFMPMYRYYVMNGFFCSWSSLHRHSVAMANSYAQSLVMPLTTVIKTGKCDHVYPILHVSTRLGSAWGWTDQFTCGHGSCVCELAWKQLYSTSSALCILPLFVESYNILAEISLASDVWALIKIRKAGTQSLEQLSNFVCWWLDGIMPQAPLLLPLSLHGSPQPQAKQFSD